MTLVYAIECVESGFSYIGCTSSKLNRRMNEHMSLLRRGKHTAEKMLEDWQTFGRDAFAMKVLEKLPDKAHVELRREAELRWMRHFKGMGRLYNAQMISFGPGEGYKLRSHTPEANEKRRQAQLGKPKAKGHGAKISATKKRLGQRPTLEAARLGAIACHKVRYAKG